MDQNADSSGAVNQPPQPTKSAESYADQLATQLLQRDGLLRYDWQESEQGPPRKYYALTEYGQRVMIELKQRIRTLSSTLKTLEKGAKS